MSLTGTDLGRFTPNYFLLRLPLYYVTYCYCWVDRGFSGGGAESYTSEQNSGLDPLEKTKKKLEGGGGRHIQLYTKEVHDDI